MHPHVTLKLKDGFFGLFKSRRQQVLIAPIIRLGTESAFVAITKDQLNTLQVGDQILFLQIIGAANICFHDHIPTKINWIRDVNHSEFMFAGCGFGKTTDSVHDQINRFVDSERSLRGQYLKQSS